MFYPLIYTKCNFKLKKIFQRQKPLIRQADQWNSFSFIHSLWNFGTSWFTKLMYKLNHFEMTSQQKKPTCVSSPSYVFLELCHQIVLMTYFSHKREGLSQAHISDMGRNCKVLPPDNNSPFSSFWMETMSENSVLCSTY